MGRPELSKDDTKKVGFDTVLGGNASVNRGTRARPLAQPVTFAPVVARPIA